MEPEPVPCLGRDPTGRLPIRVRRFPASREGASTVGHNRIGRNIREAIRPRLPAGAPCDTYGPQDAIETVGGALREPDAFIACSRPHRNAVAVPAPIVVFEVVSPGRGHRRRDEEKVDEYEFGPLDPPLCCR